MLCWADLDRKKINHKTDKDVSKATSSIFFLFLSSWRSLRVWQLDTLVATTKFYPTGTVNVSSWPRPLGTAVCEGILRYFCVAATSSCFPYFIVEKDVCPNAGYNFRLCHSFVDLPRSSHTNSLLTCSWHQTFLVFAVWFDIKTWQKYKNDMDRHATMTWEDMQQWHGLIFNNDIGIYQTMARADLQ